MSIPRIKKAEEDKIRGRLQFLETKLDAGLQTTEDIEELRLLKRKLYFNK